MPCRPLRATAAPRSGLAWKNFIDTGAGVIDADYRGEVKVLLFNHESVLRDEIVEAPKQEARLFQVRYLEMFAVLAREAARES